MANTYKLISSYTATGAVTSISFSSIPATYTDLVVKVSCNNTTSTDGVYIEFNGSTSGYTFRVLRGDGTSAISADQAAFGTNGVLGGYNINTANMFNNVEFYIPNYAGSNNKSVSADGVQEANTTTAYALINAGQWANASAINSIRLFNSVYQFGTNSTASLYGIKNS